MGVRVYIRRVDGRISGLFAYDDALGACVLLNANHTRERRTQTAAHECAHLLSTRRQAEILDGGFQENSRAERYAAVRPRVSDAAACGDTKVQRGDGRFRKADAPSRYRPRPCFRRLARGNGSASRRTRIDEARHMGPGSRSLAGFPTIRRDRSLATFPVQIRTESTPTDPRAYVSGCWQERRGDGAF